MSRTYTAREKVLMTFVGGVVLLFLNLFVINYFLTNNTRLRAERVRKTAQLRAMKTLLANAPLWQQREARVAATQPRIENEAAIGVQLLTQIQELAKRDSVNVEEPKIGAMVPGTAATAISVELQTKSTWPALITFLEHLQGPEQFIVVESANLRVDTSDPTMMRGNFKIAKWYAPKFTGDRRSAGR